VGLSSGTKEGKCQDFCLCKPDVWQGCSDASPGVVLSVPAGGCLRWI